MKRLTIPILFLSGLLFLCPGVSMAQFPDTLDLDFGFEGFGNMIMDSPPIYSGDIVSGDPELAGGTWWMQIDDSSWPPTTDPEARWEFIFNNYFVYDPDVWSWTAEFSGDNLPQKPTWEIQHPANGTLGGTLVISVSFFDWDCDGILDVEERTMGVFSGTLMVMKYGTGNFSKYCGAGSYSGNMENTDPANFVDDFVYGDGSLNLINCEIGVAERSWGDIKAMYR